MVQVSPGAYWQERDFSLYAPALATSIFGVVGTATKGPMNTRTLITDEGSLVQTFGPPSVDHLGLMAAVHYLRRGRQLLFVRVGTYARDADTIEVNDVAGPAGVPVLEFTPLTPGTWANNVSVKIEAATHVVGAFKISILETLSGVTYTVEVYDNVLINGATDINYVETRLANSAYVSVSRTTAVSTTLVSGTTQFSGGSDGDPADTSDVIGTVGSPPVAPATGLQLFRNPEDEDVNLLAVPGYNQAVVIQEIIDICQTRADCLGLLSTPSGKSVQQAVDWHNGKGGGGDDPTTALNSSYAALYYPWVQVYDGYSDSDFDVPPEGHVAAVMAYTDQVADPWFAAAGLNRGLLTSVLSVQHSATQGERDFMYSYGNAVNPIINYSGQGHVIWGQRTLQRKPSALDRINVRRLMLYMEKVIATAVRYLVFEPNDSGTWRRFVNLVEPVCRSIQNRRGIFDFRVICDETTNTPDVIDRNEMVGKILIKPTKTAEIITVQFTLLPTGASFEEFAAL
jgi:hypothetical protein